MSFGSYRTVWISVSDRNSISSLGGLIPYSVLVDAASGQESGSKLEHTHAVLTAAFSADGRRLLTGGMDGITRLWSVPDGKLLDQRSLHENVTNVALSLRRPLPGRGDRRLDPSVDAPVERTREIPHADWRSLPRELLPDLSRGNPGASLAIFSPDGRHVLPTGRAAGSAGARRLVSMTWPRNSRPVRRCDPAE